MAVTAGWYLGLDFGWSKYLPGLGVKIPIFFG